MEIVGVTQNVSFVCAGANANSLMGRIPLQQNRNETYA